jgi:hypothetical protein
MKEKIQRRVQRQILEFNLAIPVTKDYKIKYDVLAQERDILMAKHVREIVCPLIDQFWAEEGLNFEDHKHRLD